MQGRAKQGRPQQVKLQHLFEMEFFFSRKDAPKDGASFSRRSNHQLLAKEREKDLTFGRLFPSPPEPWHAPRRQRHV